MLYLYRGTLSLLGFYFYPFTFIFNIIVVSKITYSYWFAVIFFLLQNKFFENDSFLSTIIHGSKKTYYLKFNMTHGFFIGPVIYLINQSHQLHRVDFVNIVRDIFYFECIHLSFINYRYNNWFKIVFLVLKDYSLPLELCFFFEYLLIVCFYIFDDSFIRSFIHLTSVRKMICGKLQLYFLINTDLK